MPPVRKQFDAAGSYQEITGVTAETQLTDTVAGSILRRLTISSSDAAAQTCTLEDGTGNTVHQFEVPTVSSRQYEFNIEATGAGWFVTPSDAQITVLAEFDV